MYLSNYYWYFPEAVPHKLCDDIVSYGKEQKAHRALVGRKNEDDFSEKEIKETLKKRNSTIAWLEEPWILREIRPYVDAANSQAKWNFDIEKTEAMQFTEYTQNQFYGWHIDSGKPYAEPELYGLIRKLSVSVSLSSEEEYDGGELEFYCGTKGQVCKEARKKGTVVVFPSFVWHRAHIVTRGTRYSLVMWMVGKPFR